jgi:hypothetical protein
MDVIAYLLSAFGGGVVALIVAGFLGRHLIKQLLSKELENHKAQLEQKSAVLKTELSIYAHEQNVGLSRIDAQRSDAILKLWSILSEWNEVYVAIVAPNERLNANPAAAIPKYRHWAKGLMAHMSRLSMEGRNCAIMFDQPTYEVIVRCGTALTKLTADFVSETFENVDIAAIADHAAFLRTINTARQKLHESVAGDVDTLRSQLVREFRILMMATKVAGLPDAPARGKK